MRCTGVVQLFRVAVGCCPPLQDPDSSSLLDEDDCGESAAPAVSPQRNGPLGARRGHGCTRAEGHGEGSGLRRTSSSHSGPHLRVCSRGDFFKKRERTAGDSMCCLCPPAGGVLSPPGFPMPDRSDLGSSRYTSNTSIFSNYAMEVSRGGFFLRFRSFSPFVFLFFYFLFFLSDFFYSHFTFLSIVMLNVLLAFPFLLTLFFFLLNRISEQK